jgi:hypothetical protein
MTLRYNDGTAQALRLLLRERLKRLSHSLGILQTISKNHGHQREAINLKRQSQ